MHQNIALSKLKPSPHNVRKTGGQSIDDLAASIRAHGLLQNLTVTTADKGFAVVAGGRRLAALKLLAKQKHIAADFEVPCLLVADEAATEASIAENTVREAMHPADQFEAFRQLIDGGKSIADTAAAFGVTETVVKQRLKLANVSPKLLVEYRAGNATLEQMQALAISDDHAAQEAAWAAGDDRDYLRTPHNLRRALTNTDVSSTDNRAMYIGLDAYEAAGGVVRRDLFGANTYLADAALLDQLVVQKLDATAEAVMAEGWAWVKVIPAMTWNERSEYDSAGKPKRRAFTEAEQAQWAALQTRNDELEEIIENSEQDDCSDLPEQVEYNRVAAEMRELNASRDQWPAKIKAVAGALVYLDDEGVNIDRGLLKPGQRLGDGKGVDADPVVEDPKPKKDPSALSQSSEERLHGEVTAIVREQVESQVALAALASSLWRDINRSGESLPVKIGKLHTYIPPAMAEAITARQAKAPDWFDDLEARDDDIFDYLLTCDLRTITDLIAFCAAQQIVLRHDGAEFADKAGINIADHWQVTEAWLAAQPKGYILAALDEIGACTPDLAKLKAAQVAARAVKPLKAAGWLPKPLRVEGGDA